MGAREYWYDWYDVRGRLLTDLDTSKGSTLLVGIGCGKGHDLAAFDAVFGAIGESSGADLILQDLPQVLDSIEDGELSSRIKKTPHNLFHDQPVKGGLDSPRIYVALLKKMQVPGDTFCIMSCTTGPTNTAIRS